MSYNIHLCEPETGKVIEFDTAHDIKDGTYCLGGTTEAWLNITHNYSKHFYHLIDAEEGIRKIYGMTGFDSIAVLQKAIDALGDDVTDDYWEPTEGNAKQALCGLIAFAKARPDGIWDGD